MCSTAEDKSLKVFDVVNFGKIGIFRHFSYSEQFTCISPSLLGGQTISLSLSLSLS